MKRTYNKKVRKSTEKRTHNKPREKKNTFVPEVKEFKKEEKVKTKKDKK